MKRRLTVPETAFLLWAGCTAVYLLFASKAVLTQHTPFNHFAHQAKAWLSGSLAMLGPPPPYTQNNDFAFHGGQHHVVFPAFPAVLLLPLVAFAERVEDVRDGRLFVLLAGLGPAALYLGIEKLRALGRSALSSREAVLLALTFAFGSTYFFVAEQGTVWFAAHVVGVVLLSLYALASLGGTHPFAAGLALGLAFFTRTPMIFALPLFVAEAARASLAEPRAGFAFLRRAALFAVPFGAVLLVVFQLNQRRFGSPFDFGYQHLQIAWQKRIQTWGLFSFHYVPRNLSVILAGLPFVNRHPGPDAAALQVSIHGLALWVTSPFLLLLVRARRWAPGTFALLLAALFVALPSIAYQNTGQIQFGQRFTNDWLPLVMLATALVFPRIPRSFWALAAIAVLVNAFGAATFGRPEHTRFYAFSPDVLQAD